MKSACAVDKLSFRYGHTPVLEDISFSAAAGKILALAGPNGSGKSTLLRLLAGLETPDFGTIRLFDQEAQKLSPRERARRVAYMPQLMQDDLPFTAQQLVSLGRSPWQNSLGFEKELDQNIVREAMRYVDVERLASRQMSQLSGGERQRVSLARALCQQPELFLLDEPTAALDYGHQIQIMDMLGKLRSEQSTGIILVSHDINLAAMYADEIMLLKKGRIVAFGAPAKVLTQKNVTFVYSCPMLVDINPCTQTPRISPLPTGRSS